MIGPVEINSLCLENPADAATHVQYAVRMKAAENTDGTRLPTHFVLLLDVSESMLDRNKLENVKHSASLVLKFLGPTDYISVVTFGDTGKILCNAVSCVSEGKESVQSILHSVRADGCTNMSASLILVKEIMTGFRHPAKTGVLLLTDGHANRGVYTADGIKGILRTIHEEFPSLSFSFVAYGTDHNADLLKDMAESAQGSYSIVEDLEGAATVIGDTLGGLFSCKAQMVCAKFPPGTKSHGQFTMKDDGTMEIGDIYEGSETVLLVSVPKGSIGEPFQITGVELPSLKQIQIVGELDAWSDAPLTPAHSQFRISVELTGLRYTCSKLFRRIRQMDLDGLEEAIAAFRAKVFHADYNGNLVAEMLREECKSLETAFQAIRRDNLHGGPSTYMRSQLAQHEAYTNLGRGATRAVAADDDDDDNPVNFAGVRFGTTTAAPLTATTSAYSTTPYASRTARRVTNIISTISMVPNDPNAVLEAAALAASASQMAE